MRPLGEFTQALLHAAERGPGDLVSLAHRAQVSVPVARYTASRMVARGNLIVVQPGRPALLGLPDEPRPVHSAAPELAAVLRSFADL